MHPEQEKVITGLASFCTLAFIATAGVSIANLIGILKLQSEVDRIHDWEDPQVWRSSACNVLTAGVSCVEDDTGSTCHGLGRNISEMTVVNDVPIFDWQDLSVCPGTYWCAVEGERCTCDGIVTYATELFNGKEFFEHLDFSHRVSGTIKCGTDKFGKAYADPAPYHSKFCFCTPQGILDKLHVHDVIVNNFSRCAKEANSDFMAADISQEESAPSEVSRRLDVSDNDKDDVTSGRRLSSRRRRTYSYTPWALVRVQQAGDSANSEKSFLTCAYEYGSPQASWHIYQGDDYGVGAYAYSREYGDADLTSLIKNWTSKETCSVRMAGQSGADTCAVSFGELGGLSQRNASMTWWSWCWMIVFGVVSLPFAVVSFLSGRIVVAKMVMDLRQQYQPVSSPTASS
eukprot:TRINITY_DN48518_c0_g1_i1.p1 TRINITY_DN48518_c0_g1~~TRINITY_DN48518_c0_g1_i1.p1  ORF type:complete len:422 (+),score=49.53 TRINITY_DN48518_c0_g1_i1:66-1268(+)